MNGLKSVLRLAENIDIRLNNILFNHKAKDLKYKGASKIFRTGAAIYTAVVVA
jgi:hypothetical protein